MSETPVGLDLLESFQVLSKLVVQGIGRDLRELTILNVLPSVEEPVRDLELPGVIDDGKELFNLLLTQFSSPFRQINISLLADKVGESSSNPSDGRQGIHDVSFTIDVGVEDSKNVLKLLRDNKCRIILRGLFGVGNIVNLD